MKIKVIYALASALALFISACEKESPGTATTTTQPGNEPPAVLTKNGNEHILTAGKVVYKTGFQQTSADNQDAYVQKLVDGKEEWKKIYDTSPDDSKGVALNFASNRLYVAFVCTGGNTSFKATAGAFQNSYGQDGGFKVTFLAQINPGNGEITAASFIGGQLDGGRGNTFFPDDSIEQPLSILPNNQVQLQAIHAYDRGDGRLTPGTKDEDCKKSGGKWKGIFNEKMALVSGDCF
jgi:hypothetical protein